MTSKSSSYNDAGVNIDLAHSLLDKVKSKIKSTHRQEVLHNPGAFGGLFQLDLTGYKNPVLVSSVDGVGTKLIVASMMNNHKTVGHDLVNHCINDITCQGAEPLYFMDYLGIGKLKSPLYEEVLEGMADACQSQGVSLLGGETAEMPGMYGDDYDLVGAITGIVDKSQLITGDSISENDIIIGIKSNGLHTNGYSLARNVLFEQAGLNVNSILDGSNESIGELLLKPHICYWPAIKEALGKKLTINGIAHITGGGPYDNISRILPSELNAVIDPDQLDCPAIFKQIQEKGSVANNEMFRVFNMGIGMTWILPDCDFDQALNICKNAGFTAAKIGKIIPGNGKVKICGIDY